MKPRRILLLTPSLEQGGAEVVIRDLAMALCKTRHSVAVVSMLEPADGFARALEAAGIAVVPLGMRRGRPNLRGLIRLFVEVRRFRPDIIHGHMFFGSILARVLRVLLRVPAVCTIHSEIECSHRRRSARSREWIYRITNRACDRLTAVSERVRERYVQRRIVRADQVEVIENGVDLQRFRPNPGPRDRIRKALGWETCFIWLAVGRLELAKDFPTLIRAFRQLRAAQPHCRLAIAGDGRLRPQLERLIQDQGLQSEVKLLGNRDDIPELLNACDALVMSSEWEGGPLVLLEAGACEKPVVATEVGAAPRIVAPGRTGVLVPVRDVGRLTQAMRELMTTPPEIRAEMGREARRRMLEHFSLEITNGRYLDLYERVLAR